MTTKRYTEIKRIMPPCKVAAADPQSLVMLLTMKTITVLMLAILACLSSVQAKQNIAGSSPTASLNEAERWILQEVNAGRVADLSTKFPVEGNRKVSSSFLTNLLTGSLQDVKPRSQGIRIASAIFDESLDLSNSAVRYETHLNSCRFDEEVSLASAVFDSMLDFTGCSFAKTCSFNSLKINGSLFCCDTTTFNGSVDFSFMTVAGSIQIINAHFLDQTTGVNFAAMQTTNYATFSNTVFVGQVSFNGANIQKNFYADGLQVKDASNGANFSDMKVGGSLYLNKNDRNTVTFVGPASFRDVEITGDFVADEAQFMAYGADFHNMKVSRGVSLEKAIFNGPANFTLLVVANDFSCNEAQFLDLAGGVILDSATIHGQTTFVKSVFEGPVNMENATFSNGFIADDAQFKNTTKPVKLNMKCNGKASFRRATFAGTVSFAGSTFVDLFLGENKSDDNVVPEMDVSRIIVSREISIQKIKIRSLQSAFQRIEGAATISIQKVESADFRYSEFSSLDLSGTELEPNLRSLHLEGIKYKSIRASSENSESNSKLLSITDRAIYSEDIYNNLASSFAMQGNYADSDRTFVSGKQRERSEYLSGIRWVQSWLLDILVGYGRHPWYATLPCIIVVIFGCFVFAPDKMEPRQTGSIPGIYNRFWYSAGLFLPIVSLESDKFWKPKDDGAFRRNYARVHVLLGWLLVPVVLAAITGFIK